MANQSILEKLLKSPRLPTPPAIAMQLIKVTGQSTCSLKDVAKLLLCDPGLCGKLLGLVNSSLYAHGHSVTSIDRALQVLGIKRVRALALGLTLPALQFKSASGDQLRDHWRKSLCQAIATRELAARLRRPDPEGDMMAGLLCDLGILLLEEVCSAEYERVRARLRIEPGGSLCVLEEELVGASHADAGASVLQSWGMPGDVVDAIRHHEAPPNVPGAASLPELLQFTGRIADLNLGVQHPEAGLALAVQARERFGMDESQLIEFLDSIQAKIDEFAKLVDLKVGPAENLSKVYSEGTAQLTELTVEMSLDNLKAHEDKTRAEEGRRQAEDAFKKQEEHLRRAQKMEAIGRLARGVAHDFNNLLTVINGYSQLMLSMLGSAHPCHELAKEINQAGARAAVLTKQLLAFSRKQLLEPQVFNVNTLIAGMESMLRRLVSAPVEMAIELAPNVKNVKADPGQLEQVFINLALNGRDAIPCEGKVTIATEDIVVEQAINDGGSVIVPGPFVRINVRDDGVGMAPEALEQVFEPFFLNKDDGKGSGLGLSVVHGIIKQSGGYIRAKSAVGQGTTFHIYLPAVDEPATVAAPTCSPSVEMPIHFKGTVLLAEDQAAVRALAKRTLEQCGFTTLVAHDGNEALRLCEECGDTVDLLITDVIMPQLSGPDLARLIRSRRPGLKVIYTSGYLEDTIVRNDPDERSATFIQKPYTPRDLALKVRSVLS